jgi:SAM-dependent methyltransferase
MTEKPRESDLDPSQLQYFDAQRKDSNAEYWRRLGLVDLRGKSVIDVGCGHGALCIDAAERGAKRVLGVDIDRDRIRFAQINLEKNYPQFIGNVSFHDGRVEDICETFDVVISKDTFEHIDDLPATLQTLATRLKSNGVLLAGFSPLYFSPFGDHGRYMLGSSRRIPWLPAILPEPILFRLASRRRGDRIRDAQDVGLNKLTPAQFRKIISDQAWDVLEMQTNCGDKRGMGLMRKLANVKPLEKYFTVSIYAKLKKPRSRVME